MKKVYLFQKKHYFCRNYCHAVICVSVNVYKEIMGNDKEVYEKFKLGVIDTLYVEWYASLMAFAARYLTSNYALMAEDCVQDAIVKAWQTHTTFTSPFQLKSFLFICIRNTAISMLRRISTQQGYASLPREEAEYELMAMMIEQETIDMLHEAIRELPEKYQQVFELSFKQGLRNKEAARLLGITVDGFNKRKARMISLLRGRFHDNDLMQLLITFLMA